MHVRFPSPGIMPATWLTASSRSNPPGCSSLYEAVCSRKHWKIHAGFPPERCPRPSGGGVDAWCPRLRPMASFIERTRTLAYARRG